MNGFNCSIETVWCQLGSSIEDVNCDYVFAFLMLVNKTRSLTLISHLRAFLLK
uniref:Uncharacterized protein n=1 Tax=Romanomermis culicivorax TaxID=13658 RepID=A0A915KF15_ROMCU